MSRLVDPQIQAVTWAPTTDRRRHRRGFDQAELLAKAVSDALGRPCRRMLVRDGDTNQTGHDRISRLNGPRFAPTRAPTGSVLVVDDVRTTGSTLCAAGDALTQAGAHTVVGLTLAATL